MARILVIDDDEINREVFEAMLASAGHQVTQVESGEAGLAFFHQQTVDLVITDIEMGGITGLDVIKELKSEYPDVKIIAVAAAGDWVLKEAEELGADLTMQKPFLRNELINKVESILE